MEIGEKIRDCDSDRVATDPVKEEKHERYRQSYAHHILVARGRCLRVFGALSPTRGNSLLSDLYLQLSTFKSQNMQTNETHTNGWKRNNINSRLVRLRDFGPGRSRDNQMIVRYCINVRVPR